MRRAFGIGRCLDRAGVDGRRVVFCRIHRGMVGGGLFSDRAIHCGFGRHLLLRSKFIRGEL
ncbi:MAG: hypothetical protein ABWY66_17150, partial [Xanthobacteraceae bacterium]